MANTLINRVAFVTGGAGALGRGIARALLEEGAKVVLGDLDEGRLAEAKLELSAYGDVAYAKLDLTDFSSIERALDTAEQAFGTVDILVNNAGVAFGKPIMDIPERTFDLTFAVNVKGLFLMSRAFAARLMRLCKPGNILNISSNAAKVCFEGMADYNASKAAVSNLTQSMAKEWAKVGINVNAICPGAVDTDMLRNCMLDVENATGGKVTVEDCRRTWGPPQLGRLVQPYEVGRVAAFLVSDAALLIRGQAISVDAGNTPY